MPRQIQYNNNIVIKLFYHNIPDILSLLYQTCHFAKSLLITFCVLRNRNCKQLSGSNATYQQLVDKYKIKTFSEEIHFVNSMLKLKTTND